MTKSQFHWLRSRACVTTAVEQHAIGATGLADILARCASEEGRQYRIAYKAENMADRLTVSQTAMVEYARTEFHLKALSEDERIAELTKMQEAWRNSEPGKQVIALRNVEGAPLFTRRYRK